MLSPRHGCLPEMPHGNRGFQTCQSAFTTTVGIAGQRRLLRNPKTEPARVVPFALRRELPLSAGRTFGQSTTRYSLSLSLSLWCVEASVASTVPTPCYNL